MKPLEGKVAVVTGASRGVDKYWHLECFSNAKKFFERKFYL
jgi:short-subunit dehydrogenase